MKTAHLIGNGPSYEKFLEYEKQPDEFVLGCNCSPVENVDASIFVDKRLVRLVALKQIKYDKPMLVNISCEKTYKDRLNNVLEYFDKKKLMRHSCVLSSGHYGACWLINKGFTTIHVWGCDVLNGSNSLNSYSDKYYRSNCKSDKKHVTRFSNNWRGAWQKIFDKNPDITFKIHV